MTNDRTTHQDNVDIARIVEEAEHSLAERGHAPLLLIHFSMETIEAAAELLRKAGRRVRLSDNYLDVLPA
jgi:hypothetical protein